MYKFNNGDLPSVFNDMFSYNIHVHSYNTRQSTLLHVPVGHKNIMYSSIRFKGVTFWNSINNSIDKNSSIHTYKKKLKNLLLDNSLC